MGEDQGRVGAPVEGQERSPEELRREIEDTREELGDTAAALAEKTDVKTRAREKFEDVKRTLSEKKESFASDTGGGAAATQAKAKAQENPVATSAVAAFVLGFLLGRVTSR